MSRNNLSRRSFLQGTAVTALSMTVVDSFLSRIFREAVAATTTPKYSTRYLHVSLPGAPPRWLFDLPLTPNGKSDAFVKGGFGSMIVPGLTPELSAVEYRTVLDRGIHLPPVWQMDVGGHDFSKLLHNSMFIRGVDMEIDNHGVSNSRQTAPIPGGSSLMGLVADRAGTSFAGVQSGAASGRSFRSPKGMVAIELNFGGKNVLANLLAPFTPYVVQSGFQTAESAPLISRALAEFQDYAEYHKFPKSAIAEAHDRAAAMISGSLTELLNSWPSVYARYTDLMRSSMTDLAGIKKVSGFADGVIKASATEGRFFSETSRPTSISDLRNSMDASTNVPRLAESLALTEILFTKQLCSSAQINLNPLSGLIIDDKGTRVNVSNDQHNTGNILSTWSTTLSYRSLLAGLSELVSRLDAAGIWKDTVIHVAAEFNRAPRSSGAGSDHGVSGSNVTILSGRLSGTHVIGNIERAPGTGTNYTGTWGKSANYDFTKLGSPYARPIVVQDVARTLSALLDVGQVTNNGYSLVRFDSTLGKFVPAHKEAKNV